MRLKTPESLHYPITVTKLRRKLHDAVDRNAPLFDYEYTSKVLEGREPQLVERKFPTTFESYAEGTVTEWFIKEGTVISRGGAAIAEIEEPCKHEVQFGGMCANCGKDMTTVEYNTVTRDTSRATVNTVHGHTALLVSQAEAFKSDEEAKRRLLSSRKLSLVVDLDQTIIHATCEPTVGEWQRDPTNPNHEALKDVRSFQLLEDGGRATWYYVKLRPGLMEFLDVVSKHYELHVYTMGTRIYAQHIVEIVDPEKKLFADRILSRDESGSLTAKNLKRLFPVDTKMVVIIDDRADVWHWNPNLIKVVPYDFFIGVGDINASFLPKRQELEAAPPATVAEQTNSSPGTNGVNGATPNEDPAQTTAIDSSSAINQLISMGGGNDPSKLQEQTTQRDETIASQLNDRPLLQKQRMLDAVEEENTKTEALVTENGESAQPEKEEASPDPQQHKHRSNLLQDDDKHLQYLERSLLDVHHAFYDEYDRKLTGSQGGRIAELRPGHGKKRAFDDLQVVPDVSSIMADKKQKVLQGVSMIFSGLIPRGINTQTYDTVVWAKSFGADVTEDLFRRTTHVVASPLRRTVKVRQAARRPNRIRVVSQEWLFDSISQWRKLPEKPYTIHTEASEEGEDATAAATTAAIFEGLDSNFLSSSEEDITPATEDETSESSAGRLRINTKLDDDDEEEEQEELETHIPSISREDSSPHEETNEDWEGMNDELADFLGSDAEDGSESDAESTKSADSAATSTTGTLPPSSTGATTKKRKRGPDLEAGSLATTTSKADGDDSDVSVKGGGSELQRRKKKALARTSSLTNDAALVSDEIKSSKTTSASISKDAVAVEDSEIATPTSAAVPISATAVPAAASAPVNNVDGNGEGDDSEDDAALEAELEAEMMRQAEEEEEDGGR